MASVAELAYERQRRLIAVSDLARARALQAWKGIDFANLDQSWSASVGPAVTAQASNAQLTLAHGSDLFTARVAASTANFTPDRSAIVPEAFSGVDGAGRDVSGILYGAVTTTKEAVGTGLGSARSLEAGATYLAAIIKTVIADLGRSADLVSSAGKGFTHYVRVVGGSACSRCAILAGIPSGETAFLRHVSCQCTAAPVYSVGKPKAPAGLHASPQQYFDSLSAAEQDRVFTKAGAEAIRAGADPVKVVSARRGAKGIGYSGHGSSPVSPAIRNRMVKTTIGYRPDGTPVQVYATGEGTKRGVFSKQNGPGRVRLMPETIMTIAGDDLKLRQAFLRDAGYLDYLPPGGFTSGWVQRLDALRAADRRMVDKATLKYGNFTLG